jgi:hypothetical protein
MATNKKSAERQDPLSLQCIILECTDGEVYKKTKNCHVVYPLEKRIIPHLLRCRRFAIANYGFTFGALDLQHPRLLQRQGYLRLTSESLSGRLEIIQLNIDTKMEGTSTICPASPVHVAPSFPIHSPINTASSFYIPPSFGNVHTVRKLPPINSRTSASSISNS